MATNSAGAPFIGFNYGRIGSNLPHPSQVVKLLQEHHKNVKNVKIFDADPNVVKAFRGSGIKLIVAATNGEVVGIANSLEVAQKWVTAHIKEHHDTITAIAVGNEWLSPNNHIDKSNHLLLVRAMENIHLSLKNLHLDNKIKVSTPHAFDAQGFPPSEGHFKEENVPVMKSILDFLHRTNSFFMLNVYPFFPYAEDQRIDTNYALFKEPSKHVPDGRLTYTNLLDAMVDTMITAMNRLDHGKYKDMKIVITETGWPNGGSGRRGVTAKHAEEYNQGVIKHVLEKRGTPLRIHHSFPTYIFALFNEDKKAGGVADEEKYWGVYNPQPLSAIYKLTT